MFELKNRKIIRQISKFLTDDEIIVLHGARQVGKISVVQYLITKTLCITLNKKEKAVFKNIKQLYPWELFKIIG